MAMFNVTGENASLSSMYQNRWRCASCRCAILPASAPQWAQKTWSCWCNGKGISSDWTVACTDTSCQTVTSSSRHGDVNKDTCHTARCRGRTIQVAFWWRPIQGSKMIASRRFPATWHQYDALCFTKIKIILRFLHEWCRPIFDVFWGTRRATKATQNVRYFPQDVSCGTNEAFAQNSTHDCARHMQADHAPNVIWAWISLKWYTEVPPSVF